MLDNSCGVEARPGLQQDNGLKPLSGLTDLEAATGICGVPDAMSNRYGKSNSPYIMVAGTGMTETRTGKMVPGDNGELIEQIIVTYDAGPGASGFASLRPAPDVGTIYFVGPQGGPIKIGFATRLSFRIKELRSINAFPIEIWASVEGPPILERQYHKRFAEHRLHGEWFSPHPDILAEIARLSAAQVSA